MQPRTTKNALITNLTNSFVQKCWNQWVFSSDASQKGYDFNIFFCLLLWFMSSCITSHPTPPPHSFKICHSLTKPRDTFWGTKSNWGLKYFVLRKTWFLFICPHCRPLEMRGERSSWDLNPNSYPAIWGRKDLQHLWLSMSADVTSFPLPAYLCLLPVFPSFETRQCCRCKNQFEVWNSGIRF